MSDLQYYSYPGFGDWGRDAMHYSQVVRVGDNIIVSGQGGWDRKTCEIKPDLKDEIDQAFENVDFALKHAGGKGWSQVYRIVTYHTDIHASSERVVENFKRWLPDHMPTWNMIGVKQLGLDTMHIEVEVQAYDEEGAAEARKAQAKGTSSK
ncbi:putative L-PSP endoribonuclease family protein [Hypoxylon sp. FL1857]|nr:putative L-PSP endoribonuclease family protein [Hypoxylon sp. FL1857]